MIAPYLELVQMADEELALAASGRWEELPGAMERRARRAAALPASPPAAARSALERLTLLQARRDELLAAGLGEVRRELGSLQRGRGAVRGYHGGAGPRGGRVDGAG